jgi:hypothetical protein
MESTKRNWSQGTQTSRETRYWVTDIKTGVSHKNDRLSARCRFWLRREARNIQKRQSRKIAEEELGYYKELERK